MVFNNWAKITTVLFVIALFSSPLLFYHVYLRGPLESERTIYLLSQKPVKKLTVTFESQISQEYVSSDFVNSTPFIGHVYPMGGWTRWMSTDSKVTLTRYFTITPNGKTVLCFTWVDSPFNIHVFGFEDYGDEVIRRLSANKEVFVTMWGQETAEVSNFITLTLDHLNSYQSEKWNSQPLFTDTIENLELRMMTLNGYIEVYPNLLNYWTDDTGKLVTALINYYTKTSDPKALDLIWQSNNFLFAAQNQLGHFWTRKYLGPAYISTEHEYEKYISVRNWLIEFNYIDEPPWFKRDGVDVEYRWEPKIQLMPRVEIKKNGSSSYQDKFLRDYQERSIMIITQSEENVTICLQYVDPDFPTVSIYVSILRYEPSAKIWFSYVTHSDLEDFIFSYGFEALEDFWLLNGGSGVGPRYCYVQDKVLERNNQDPMLIINEEVRSLVLFDNASSLRGRMLLLSFKDSPQRVYDCFSHGDADQDGIREFHHLCLRYELGQKTVGSNGMTGIVFITPFYDVDVWQWENTINKICRRVTTNLIDSGYSGFGGFELSDVRNQAPVIESLLKSAIFWTSTPHGHRSNSCFETGKVGLNSYLESILLGRILSGYEIGYLSLACSHAYHLTHDESYRVWQKQLADQIISQQITNPSDPSYTGYTENPVSSSCYLDVVAVYLLALKQAYNDFGDQKYFESAKSCIENWIHIDAEQGAWGYREQTVVTDGMGQTNKQGILLKALVEWGYIDLAKQVAEFFFKYSIPPYGLAPVAPTFNDPWGASWDINSETLAWSLDGLVSLKGL